MEGVCGGGMQRGYTDGICRAGMQRGMWRMYVEGDAYFEVLYPLWVVDGIRTLKVHQCLSVVTTGCP